ncbi:copper homeostasis protein CutC [Urechidicola sp. KH5]
MTFEVCTDSVDGAIAAARYGAKRIELCSALSVGGLTPNFGLIKACVAAAPIEVHCMIRHKEGGFIYNAEDVAVMKEDISAVKNAGAHGVVFGILTNDYEISYLNKELFEYAVSLDLEVTFHRAFDFTHDYHKAIQQLISIGFDRLLTSGQEKTAYEGIKVISDIQNQYGNQIQIMAGAGVNANNAKELAATGIQNLHFTARKPAYGATSLSMGELMIPDDDKIQNIINQFN